MIGSERQNDPDYRLVFEGGPGRHLLLAPDFTVIAASDAYLAATRTRRDTLVGRRLVDIEAAEPGNPLAPGRQELRDSLERVLRMRQPDAMPSVKCGTGERYWTPVNWPVLDPAGHIACIVHSLEDATDLVHLKRAGREHTRMARRLAVRIRALEGEIGHYIHLLRGADDQLRGAKQALARWQSAAATDEGAQILGHLTGTIAHDFNDVMTVIAGSLGAVEDIAGAQIDLRRLLDVVQRAIERGSRLTGELLAFGSQSVAAAKVDVDELLQEVRELAEIQREAAPPPLPMAGIPGERAEDVRSSRPARSAAPAARRILIVEDDPDVLDAVLAVVARLGYVTVAARDGLEALETLGGAEPLDLLFTDIVMPNGPNGIQLARRARELRPNLRVLLTSGYGFQALAESANDGFPILRKPYQRDALAETLRAVLEA